MADLAPDVRDFLGLVAYVQLEIYESASRAVREAPSLQSKEVLSHAAGIALGRYQEFAAELRRRHLDPAEVMAPYRSGIDRFVARITPGNWSEHVLLVYLVGGLFDEFFAQLALGVTDKYGNYAATLLREDAGRGQIAELLATQIREHPQLGDSLALWGRRLVGDSLLVARSALIPSDNASRDAEQIEPVFTELIATHIRRMDALGLTA